MPRPKPKFKDYQHLFNGLTFKVDTTNFNVNSKVTITCEFGHEYITSITKIKSLSHDYKTCPHCKKVKIIKKLVYHTRFLMNILKNMGLK